MPLVYRVLCTQGRFAPLPAIDIGKQGESSMDNAYSMAARYYDKLYAGKDYQGEVQRLVALLGVDANQKSLTLLDVACGTGRHLEYLSDFFQGEGLDSCPELLEAAKKRNPGVSFHLGDMTGFDLGTHFDVVTCLFGSIGYVKTPEKLRSAMRCMAAHLQPGGVLAIEPWFTPEKGRPNAVHAVFVDEPEFRQRRDFRIRFPLHRRNPGWDGALRRAPRARPFQRRRDDIGLEGGRLIGSLRFKRAQRERLVYRPDEARLSYFLTAAAALTMPQP